MKIFVLPNFIPRNNIAILFRYDIYSVAAIPFRYENYALNSFKTFRLKK